MDYQKALLDVYKKLYPDSICPNLEKCSKGMPLCGHRFSVALLGCDYGKTEKPKILFVGKEGTNDSGVIQRSKLFEPISLSDPDFRKNNWHYLGTIYTAAAFLTGYTTTDPYQINKEALLPFSELRHDFCLTNYFKCAFKTEDKQGKYHDIPTNSQMKKNCVQILLEEIKALQPDIIVIQGKHCHSSFWKKNGLLSFASVQEDYIPQSGCNISVTKYKRTDGSFFYVLWSYHPCANGRKWFKTLPAFNDAISYINNDMQ